MEVDTVINKEIRELKFVAFDLEATYSKSLGRHEIIEIGAHKLEPGTLNISTSFETLVRPLCRIILPIKQKTGITDEMVIKEKVITEIWDDFLIFIENTILLDYRTIDMSILRKTSEFYGLITITNPFLDVYRLAKRLYPNETSYSLEHFKNLLEITVASHRASSDAFTTGLLFKHVIEIFENKYGISKYKELLDFYNGHFPVHPAQRRLF